MACGEGALLVRVQLTGYATDSSRFLVHTPLETLAARHATPRHSAPSLRTSRSLLALNAMCAQCAPYSRLIVAYNSEAGLFGFSPQYLLFTNERI